MPFNGWGALAGFVLGLLLTHNLLGGLVGAFVGWVLQQRLFEGTDALPGVRQIFFETAFSVMGHVAKADGRVSEQEIRTARGIMARMSLSEPEVREAIRLFSDGKRADFPLDEVMQRFARACGRSRMLVRSFMELQLEAALADGPMSGVQRQLMERLARHLGVSAAELHQLEALILAAQRHQRVGARQRASAQRAAKSELAEAYELLGVTPEASDGEVKRAYRKLMSRHHPDKLAAQGLPGDMRALAEEKTREIRAAYELVREARGMR